MRATLIAYTQTTPHLKSLGEEFGWEATSSRPGEELIEFAGRACYQSWSKPNPATANTDAYIANVLLQRHFSVVEHASVSFYLEGVSRSLTHELVRHRHFSYSQLSQRYHKLKDAAPVIPPLFEGHEQTEKVIWAHWSLSVDAYNQLIEAGEKEFGPQSKKQVREAARCVLPNCTPTALVVTGNYRSWQEFLDKRDSPAADREIARLAKALRQELERVSPATFPRTPPVTLAEQLAPAFDPPVIQPEFLVGP